MRQDGKIIAFVFVAALLLSGRLMAFPHDETFYFTAISDKNSSNIGGISQTDILSISQDQRGVMWIGTSYGLNSFDSYNYVDYNVEDGLAGSLIQAVQSVGDSIFIGTRTGFSILDLKTSSVFNFTLDLEEDNPNYVVNYISEPVNGKLVVCTTIGIFVYNMGTKEFYQYHPVDGKKTHDVHHVDYSTYDSTWWVAAHSGLIHFNYADESFECYYCNPQNDSSLLDNRVTCVKAFDQNTIFVGTKSGLCMFSPSRKTFQKINLNNTSNYNAYQNEITSLLKYDDNSILIGTNGNGLFHYDVLSGKFKQYKHTDGHSYSISDDRIHCLFKDLCGDVWIGTQNGVCSIEKYRPKFYSYRTDTENDKTSLRNAVWCIQEISPEIFWIGTVSGVNIFNRVTGECKHFHLKNDLNNFPYNSKVRAFYYDKANDKIWIGTRYSGVYCYDFKTGQSRSFNEINNKDYYLFSSPINSIIGDADDNIWIATTYGLARLNKNTYEIKTISMILQIRVHYRPMEYMTYI
jgi:Two component regulator propeller.